MSHEDVFTVRVPATTANLGPGFDCLGLTLDVWNEVEVSVGGVGVRVDVEGEGARALPHDEHNLVVATALRRLQEAGVPQPAGLHVRCRNGIPLASGLGSSAAAVIAGLLIGAALSHASIDRALMLEQAIAIEGHPDNAAAAITGGLAVVAVADDSKQPGGFLSRAYEVPRLSVVVVTPQAQYSTRHARARLAENVTLSDAVFNLGRVPLVVEALRSGDLLLLGQVMGDRLHQEQRLALTRGAAEALSAAWEAGAAGAAVSGSGPSLFAFVQSSAIGAVVAEAMVEQFRQRGDEVRWITTTTCSEGAVLLRPGD